MFKGKTEKEARKEILTMVSEYFESYQKDRIRGRDRIPYSGRIFDDDELANLIEASLEFWLTCDHFTEEFEQKMCTFLNIKYCSFVNSGSSANLLALMSLTSRLLGDRRIKPGDEVITVACGFPTTVSPIIHCGAVPVFVDVTIPQYNIDCSKLEEALSGRTKAVFLAHTLGNPFDIEAVKAFCDRHNLWLIEDNCDALGSRYMYGGELVYTGTVGDIATSSFYPSHHITTGEGGAVYTNNPLLNKIVRSMRDWGRDCTCPPGKDDTCGHRFSGQFGSLPFGYDHKYVYSHFGFNLKATDLQAAIGCSQIEKLPGFMEKRKHNYRRMFDNLRCTDDRLILPVPAEGSDPDWFGFLITCKKAGDRDRIVHRLESYNIQTRALFAGNITRHPCFDGLQEGKDYRIIGNLKNTDRVMNDTFWIGVYPGLNDEDIDRMVKVIVEALE